MQNLIQNPYSHVDYIRLVQDNLTIHTPGAFYDVLVPEEVQAWTTQRSPNRTTVNWQFTQTKVQSKLNRHYQTIKQTYLKDPRYILC